MKHWHGITPTGNVGSRSQYLFACEVDQCWYRLTCTTEDEAKKLQAEHHCPWNGGETKVGLMVSPTLLEQIWFKLDARVDEIRSQQDTAYAKAQAAAIAEVLVLFMSPHFTTTAEISAEALRRYKARIDGDKEYETIGLNKRRLEMPPSSRTSPTPRTTQPVNKKISTKLSASDQQTIKMYAAMDGFTHADIAKLYKVSEQEIAAIAAAP
jgi:hypothetical protein